MNIKNYIDHALLTPDITQAELEWGLVEAEEKGYFGVCVHSRDVKKAKTILKKTKAIAVVGFPLGTVLTEVKVFETKLAIEHGADEIDMVIDIGAIKDGEIAKASADIKAVVRASGGKIVKVILETDLLTKDEIISGCNAVIDSGADFVKTSTGFAKNGVGATIENIKLMSDAVKKHGLKVKASGGIKTKSDAMKMIKAGADRLGTSSSLAITQEL